MIKKALRSPLMRISLGLVLMTTSLLLVGDIFFRLGDSDTRAIMEARKKLCESFAVQFSSLITVNDRRAIENTINAVVRRNPEILSAALRDSGGSVLVEAGVHQRYWKDIPFDKSTPTHTQVPIFNGDKRWGTVEVRFSPINKKSVSSFLTDPFVQLILFVAVLGFVAYLMFMKRTLRHLDPAAVIPDRVKTALDVLAEGVVLVNERAEIVLANEAFSRLLNRPAAELLGTNLSDLKWMEQGQSSRAKNLPWKNALESAESQIAVPLGLLTNDILRTFIVNGSPILDDHGAALGAMVTFDDVTELEKKNEELNTMLSSLKKSQAEVRRQNEKLQILATRDPLTSCLNRRSFYEHCEEHLARAKRDDTPLACIMMDIDHFKSVNDTFGHGVGDRVIKKVVEAAVSSLRSIDIIGRYGGEEFCILLPGLDVQTAMVVAERLRGRIEAEGASALPADADRKITSSFGVSSTEFGETESNALINEADRALYESKTNGRNQVTCFDQVEEKLVATG